MKPGRPSRIRIAGFMECGSAESGRASSRRILEKEEAVFSLLGVLGITVVLFFVVALSARLILGR